jgi:hypothetical protein
MDHGSPLKMSSGLTTLMKTYITNFNLKKKKHFLPMVEQDLKMCQSDIHYRTFGNIHEWNQETENSREKSAIIKREIWARRSQTLGRQLGMCFRTVDLTKIESKNTGRICLLPRPGKFQPRLFSYSAYSVSKVSVNEFFDNEVRNFTLERMNYPLTNFWIIQRSKLPNNEVLKDFVVR